MDTILRLLLSRTVMNISSPLGLCYCTFNLTTRMNAADVPDLQTLCSRSPRIHLPSGRLVCANYTSPRGRLRMFEECDYAK